MDINKINNIKKELGNTTLLVASKYISSNQIKEFIKLGINNFGENRSDAFISKYNDLLNENIIWHFIGHLQTNKCKEIINKISYLHSLDSLHLASSIEKYRTGTPLNCFIELHLTSSTSKNGVKEEDLDSILNTLKQYKKIKVIGFMAMSDKEMNNEEKINVFKKVKLLALKYNLKELSMGMSDDYKLALKEGATIVRLGRIICF